MPRKKLTLKEKKLLKGVVEGMSLKDAALSAGYSDKNPSQSAGQALKCIEDKDPDLFVRNGLDDDAFLQQHVIPAMRAEQTQLATFEGRFSDERKVEAWTARMNAIGLIARMKGMIKEKESGSNLGVKVVIINGANRPERVEVSSDAS